MRGTSKELRFEWPLMAEGVTAAERRALADFIASSDRLTMGSKAREFEEAWSAWQGCRYSVLVNSGSSANLILIAALRELYGPGAVLCQAVTWATNVAPVVQLGLPLELVDVELVSLGPDLADLSEILASGRIRFLFVTHLLGFCAVSYDLLELCRRHGVLLVEDCCEAHGARYGERKAGNLGLAGTFSFYYGHHMTTIEGGMVSTDDERLYETLLLLRSHGMLRELPAAEPVDGLDPRFTFLLHGFNLRPTEITGVLGLSQLPRLESHIGQRNRNLRRWLAELDPLLYHTDFDLRGASSFALPLLLRRKNPATTEALKRRLTEMGVENRPLVSGNIARQPFLRGVCVGRRFPNADIVHERGLYIGNHHRVDEEMVAELARALNEG
jgi:CDP-6-deoxy-D-xylo-4-hexulose-3-dehydrase